MSAKKRLDDTLGAEAKAFAARVSNMEKHLIEVRAREAKLWCLLTAMEAAAVSLIENADRGGDGAEFSKAVAAVQAVSREFGRMNR